MKKKVSKMLAHNLTCFFAGYYNDKNATEIVPPSEDTVAKIIAGDLKDFNVSKSRKARKS